MSKQDSEVSDVIWNRAARISESGLNAESQSTWPKRRHLVALREAKTDSPRKH